MAASKPRQSILIIGAGIGGLATGIYAQLNGYQTTIFELHDVPGGVCTSWRRKGYTFDGCLHALAGTGRSSAFHGIWRQLGVDFDRHPAIVHQELVRVEDEAGRTLVLYTDPDQLERHLKDLAPVDGPVIEAFTGALRRAAGRGPSGRGGLDVFGAQVGGSGPVLRLLPYLPMVMKWGKVNLAQFADRFQDPFLRRAMRFIQYSMPEIPTVIPLVFLAGMRRGDLGFARGGSIEFAQAIEARYRELGGRIHYRSRVTEILTEGDRAVGVHLADGSVHRADIVVSNADGHSTIYDLLGGRYVNDKIQEYYTRRVPAGPQPFAVHIAFGVAREFPSDVHAMVLLAGTAGDRPADGDLPVIAGAPQDRLDVEIYSFDPSLAPPGKSVIKAVVRSDYDFWKRLRDQDPESYRAEKQRTAAAVLEWLERRFPGLSRDVEVTDVATPLTTERYTACFRGAQAWGASDTVNPLARGFTRTLPGLENFHMVGQWAEATIGISTVAAAGRRLVKELCRQDRKRFIG